MNFLKYLPLILRGKGISEAYQEEVGQGKPWYLSRRLIGLIIALAGGFVSIQFGVTVDDNILTTISDSLVTMISTVITLYGAILAIIGYFKRAK